jgi:hypothetical protein
MLHVRIPNLIYPNYPYMHIVDQYEHLEANPPLSSLFVHKSILDPQEWHLNHAHSPLSCLSRWYCLPFFVDPISSCDVLVPKNQVGHGTICRGIPFSSVQSPSRHNTLPLSTRKHPPTCYKYSHSQQPDCRELTRVRKIKQLELSHPDKSKIRTWRSGCATSRCRNVLGWLHSFTVSQANNPTLCLSGLTCLRKKRRSGIDFW